MPDVSSREAHSHDTTTHDVDQLLARFQRAKDRRSHWEGHWQECYEFALPQREGAIANSTPGEKKGTRLYDATASDAVDQLAASLLSELTPPWSRWFGFKPGKDVPEDAQDEITETLERAATILQGHFDRSNFAVEMHQCYLDLVTAGTACLMFEEAPIGEASAFRFSAVPLADVVFEENVGGRLDSTFRRSELTRRQFQERFPDAQLLDDHKKAADIAFEEKIIVIEAVTPVARGYDYVAVLDADSLETFEKQILKTGTYRNSPFINFRWLKAPGEVYGRSPVMKALPDIKTANKVVELILKNAAIAVTGIWQADDDGVLNPATIRLEPGTIIPKAVGSAGLTPLKPANDMNLSNIVLDQMRERIRHALMVDAEINPNGPTVKKLGQIRNTRNVTKRRKERRDQRRADAAAAGKRNAIDQIKHDATRWHFEDREVKNTPLPNSMRRADRAGFEMYPQWQNAEHQNDQGLPEVKYVHPDGREVIFDGDTRKVVTDPKLKGTFNYKNAPALERAPENAQEWLEFIQQDGVIEHFLYDLAPYYIENAPHFIQEIVKK